MYPITPTRQKAEFQTRLQASAQHPFGDAETGRRAGSKHWKRSPVSTPAVSPKAAIHACAAEGGGSFAAPSGRALSSDREVVESNWPITKSAMRGYLDDLKMQGQGQGSG